MATPKKKAGYGVNYEAIGETDSVRVETGARQSSARTHDDAPKA